MESGPLFLAVLGLHCCVQAFSSCRGRGYSLVLMHRLFIAVAALIMEQTLGARTSEAAAQGLVTCVLRVLECPGFGSCLAWG